MKIAYWFGALFDIAKQWRDAFTITPSKYWHLAKALESLGHTVIPVTLGEKVDPREYDCLFAPCRTVLRGLPTTTLPLVLYLDGVYLNILDREPFQRAAAIFTTTPYRAEEYSDHLPGKPVLSVGYGITSEFDLSQSSPYKPGTTNVVFVGHFTPRELPLLLEVAYATPDLTLWLGGFATTGPMKKGMQGMPEPWLRKFRQTPSVRFLSEVLDEAPQRQAKFGDNAVGPVTYGSAARHIQHADAAIATGHGKPPRRLPHHYSLASKAYFYWMHGTPIITEHCGIQSLHTYDWNGTVYDGSAVDAQAKLRVLLSRQYDHARIHRWAQKSFSWEAVAARITDHLEALL